MNKNLFLSSESVTPNMNILPTIILLLIVILFMSGCATYTFKEKRYSNDKRYRPQNEFKSKRVWSYFGSLKNSLPAATDAVNCDCMNWPISEVRVRRNFFHSVITFATLGMASPSVIEWKCFVVDTSKTDTIREPVLSWCDTMVVDTGLEITCYGLVCDTLIENNHMDISCSTEIIHND